MINITQDNKTLKISRFNKEGNIVFINIDIPDDDMYVWEYCNPRFSDKEYSGWDDKPVRKTKSNVLNKFRIEEIIENSPQELQDEIYEFNIPKKFFVDIEIEVTDGFPDANLVKEPVTTIAFVNEQDAMIVMGTKKLSDAEKSDITTRINDYFGKFGKNISFKYFYFPSEKSMLYTFFNKVIQKMPLLTGWNFIEYDWTYLVNRCKYLKIDPSVASPSKRLLGKKSLPADRLIVDYMQIYIKWDNFVKVKESHGLDFVSNKVLGVQKVKYNGTLQQLYQEDFPTYVFYNAVDAYLVKLIDEKLNTLLTFLKIGDVSRVEANKIFYPTWVTESWMCKEFYKRKKVFVVDKKKKSKTIERKDYKGGYNWLLESGMYENNACLDFASMYPALKDQYNISPESFKGMKASPDVVVPDTLIETASGALFDVTEDSVMRTIIVEKRALRKATKKKALEIEKEIDILKQYIRESKTK